MFTASAAASNAPEIMKLHVFSSLRGANRFFLLNLNELNEMLKNGTGGSRGCYKFYCFDIYKSIGRSNMFLNMTEDS